MLSIYEIGTDYWGFPYFVVTYQKNCHSPIVDLFIGYEEAAWSLWNYIIGDDDDTDEI